MNSSDDARFMQLALAQAKAGMAEGGYPVGSVLVKSGDVVSEGRNRRVQEQDPVAHAEMDCIRRAGRRNDQAELSLYTTMSPCIMCTGTILQFGIGRVVIGDNRSSPGEMQLLIDKGVDVVLLDDPECIDMIRDYENR